MGVSWKEMGLVLFSVDVVCLVVVTAVFSSCGYDAHALMCFYGVDPICNPCLSLIVHVNDEQPVYACVVIYIPEPAFGLSVFENEVFVVVAIVIDDVCYRFIMKVGHIGDGGGFVQLYKVELSGKTSFVGCE